jgi:chromosome segregation ATPase
MDRIVAEKNELSLNYEGLMQRSSDKEEELNKLQLKFETDLNDMTDQMDRIVAEKNELSSNYEGLVQTGLDKEEELKALQLKFETVHAQNTKLKVKVKSLMNDLKKSELVNDDNDTACGAADVSNALQIKAEMEKQVAENLREIQSLTQNIIKLEAQETAYQTSIQTLSNEITDLKEAQRADHDEIHRLESLVQLVQKINTTNATTTSNETKVDIDNEETNNNVNLNLTNKCTNLEAQLKYCHEKCEKVVLKLNELKRQNESLNSKIKSIKAMAFVGS